METSRKTMRAVDEKLVFNKCWPNGDNGQEGECYNGMWVGDEKLMYDKINSGLMLAQMFPDLPCFLPLFCLHLLLSTLTKEQKNRNEAMKWGYL